MFDLVSIISGDLDDYRNTTCTGTLIDVLGLDGLKCFYRCNEFIAAFVRRTGNFANNNYVASLCVLDATSRFKTDIPVDQKAEIRLFLQDHFYIKRMIRILNEKVKNGEYVRVPKKTIPDECAVESDSISSIAIATGVAKEAVASVVMHEAKTVLVDVGAGHGALLHAIGELGLVDHLDKYVAVDNNSAKNSRLNTVIEEVVKTNHLPYNSCYAVPVDMNNYVHSSQFPETAIVVANNSVHNFSYDNIKYLVNRPHPFFGITMFSDFMFSSSDMVIANNVNLVYNVEHDVVKGTIGGLTIMERPVVSGYFPYVYPLKFHHPYRFKDDCPSDHPFWRSFAYFSNKRFVAGCDFAGSLGRPWMLVSAGYSNRFYNRPTLHPLTVDDYCWYSKTGCYLSPKLNGVCAFLYFSDDLWKVSLRGGQTFVPYHFEIGIDGKKKPTFPYRFSVKNLEQKVIFIEIVNIQGDDYPFFLGETVVKVKKRSKLNQEYWANKWDTMTNKMTAFTGRYPGLSFKPYYYFASDFGSALKAIALPFIKHLGIKLPCDGVVFTDPLGNYHSYWKPVETIDIDIVFEEGKLIAKKYPEMKIVDTRGVCALPGIYECVYDGDSVSVGVYRADKVKATDLFKHPVDTRVEILDSFERNDGIKCLKFPNTVVILDRLNHKLFVDGVLTGPYELVMNRIVSARLPFSVVKDYAKMIIANIKTTSNCLQISQTVESIPVSFFVKLVGDMAPGVDPFYVWVHLKTIGFASTFPNKAIGRKFIINYEPAFDYNLVADFLLEDTLDDLIDVTYDPNYRFYTIDGRHFLQMTHKKDLVVGEVYRFMRQARIFAVKIETVFPVVKKVFSCAILY